MVVIFVSDAAVMSVEVLGVVVSFRVVMMFYDLSAMVLDTAVVTVVVAVSGVVRVEVLHMDLHLGARVMRRLVNELTVGASVVAVVEVADKCHRRPHLVERQFQSPRPVRVVAGNVEVIVKLRVTNERIFYSRRMHTVAFVALKKWGLFGAT